MIIEKQNIIDIFPTHICKTNLNRNLTELEKTAFNENMKDMKHNSGNFSSENGYVLDHFNLKELKKSIELVVNEYFRMIWNPKNECSLYITQSWLNLTENNNFHHTHWHPNSFVSGVLYLSTGKNDTQIHFLKKLDYETISVDPVEYNDYNCSRYVMDVKNLDLMLFPSSLTHNVPTNENHDQRISLAFNTFIKGNIGSEGLYTELKL